MSEEGKCVLVIFVLALLIGIGAGGGISHALTRGSLQRSAIEAGVAEYVVDSRSGQVEFKWKEPKRD